MEITDKHVSQPGVLREEFKAYAVGLRQSFSAEAFEGFVDAVYMNFPLTDWRKRPVEDLFGAMVDFARFADQREEDEAKVQVYTPNLDESGWTCGRSVVLVLCRDLPFLVDSIRMVLDKAECPILVSKSTVIESTRIKGSLQAAFSATVVNDQSQEPIENTARETFVYFEISALSEESDRTQLCADITESISHVKQVVEDYPTMMEHLKAQAKQLEVLRGSDCEELQFLRWLTQSNFTFVGFRELDFDQHITGENLTKCVLKENPDKRLGIFSAVDVPTLELPVDEFTTGALAFYESKSVLSFSKSRTRSTVHRDVYPDYIALKKFDSEGRVVGEFRFLGFYTYAVSSMSPKQIPILRKKLAYVLEQSNLNANSHDGKRLMRCADLHPKDELFQASEQELYSCFMKILALNERNIVRLIVRKDPFQQFVSCLVYVPKELYNTRLRVKIQELLGEGIGANDVDVTTFFSESKHARTHMVFRLPCGVSSVADIDKLEPEVASLALGWTDQFKRALDDKFGESRGGVCYKRFRNAFPQGYQEHFDARAAVRDIESFQTLENNNVNIDMQLYQPVASALDEMKFRVSHMTNMLELSDVIPILEAMGLRVLGEQPFKVEDNAGTVFWIHDFQLKLGPDQKVDIRALKYEFEQAFKQVWTGMSDSDSFNRLVVVAHLNWREVNLLRAYANYMKQTLFPLSLDYIADTLVCYPKTTRALVALFSQLFDPELKIDVDSRKEQAGKITREIETTLENIRVLNQDKVYRRFLDLIHGTLRVNYYQLSDGLVPPQYLSLKFNPINISDIPEPKPSFEFFVYSARVEGVHLRTSKVARGGLRWSDREEDYRTEVLGLVKAQQVKNAVIVPSGAKGGFVAKRLPATTSRAKFLSEGVECYKIFIRGLLDLTDNIIEGKVVKPTRVVCLDGDDPYLVVAADKGTATFSDIANEISIDKGHWLGDAFASGGSQGYDHKGMGITAKGAWVSVQRHFRELGVNTQKDVFTVVGIGDMAGDVFGNGMLLSESLNLVAAFNHMHIFIDPQPDAAKSFVERTRLFNSPGTTWIDYDNNTISEGGGVFSRSDKFIQLSPQIKTLIGTSSAKLTPTDLINALLKTPVDLIWNGGIGTYVKARNESHAEVGDKANDALRINGSELRCKVFGEGGNLGLTQQGRVEFALNGGLCNTDFIDNAAGVDCSDHEVNIKILIDEQVANGELTGKQRNRLLESMTDTVSELVLKNNYRQTLALSVAAQNVDARMNEYRRFITYLENEGRLNRALEFLPSDEQLVERIGAGKTLTRPELSVLISYAKVQLKEVLAESDIADDPYCARCLFDVFPKVLAQKFSSSIDAHKLRREIVATQLANDFINNLGITALHRLTETTGSSPEEVVKAYVVARDVFGLEEFVADLSKQDYQIQASNQYDMIENMVRRVRRGTRWFLKNRRSGLDAKKEVTYVLANIGEVQRITGEMLEDDKKDAWRAQMESFKAQGLKSEWQLALSMSQNLFSGLGVVEIASQSGSSIEEATEMFFSLQRRLKLDWFATQLSGITVEDYWQASAREAYIDDLESQLRKLSTFLLKDTKRLTIPSKIDAWLENNQSMAARWTSMVTKVEGTLRTDYAMFAVALRELNDLVQVTVHS